MFGLRTFLNKSLIIPDIIKQQTRNTVILKRRWPPPLSKRNGRPEKLRGRHFVYDLVDNTTNHRQPDLKIILTQFVDGVGNVGDVLEERPNRAYYKYLLPGFAVYATPQNLRKYEEFKDKSDANKIYSSPYVTKTMDLLSKLVLQITMSKTESWTLEPWHVRASFRKAGIVVPEDAIELPSTPIKGPDLSLHEKEFLVTVTINNREKVHVRSRIYHWASYIGDRLPYKVEHWKDPCEPLFPEQTDILKEMPLEEKKQ